MLADAKIRSAKPRQKPYKLADDRGLTLLVQRSGARWWRFTYRWQGREKMLSLGTLPRHATDRRAGSARRREAPETGAGH